jgi:hypothetical protein
MLRALNIFQPAVCQTTPPLWAHDQKSIRARAAALFLAAGASCFYCIPASLRNKVLIPYNPFLLARFAGDGSLPAQAMTFALRVASLPMKFSMPIAAAILSGWVTHRLETHRATRAINTKLVTAFTGGSTDPHIVGYLKQNPSVFKQAIDTFAQQSGAIPREVFLELIRENEVSLISYSFSKKAAPELDPVAKMNCWLAAPSHEMAQCLADNGMDVNAMAGGQTPLEVNIERQRETGKRGNFYVLLGAGAKISPETQTALLDAPPQKNNRADPWSHEKLLIARALEQSKGPGDLAQIEPFDPYWFAFWKPAVTISPTTFGIQEESIVLRAGAIAIPLVLSLAHVLLTSEASFIRFMTPIGLTVLVAGLYARYVWKGAVSELDRRAILHFTTARFPSPRVTQHLITHPEGMRALTQEADVNLDKLDASGTTLLSRMMSSYHVDAIPEDFAILAVKVFYPLSQSRCVDYLTQALQHNNPAYATPLLSALPQRLSPEESVRCWIACRHPEHVDALVKAATAGSINQPDSDGYTPLLQAAKGGARNKHAYIKALLEAGANPRARVGNQRVQDLLDPSRDGAIIAFIQQREGKRED